ncbi:MAG: hypothetical protein KKF43_00800 [Proteobacteria bacterium]|nr:hypothetical protein [Pseudomonadota bacterium]
MRLKFFSVLMVTLAAVMITVLGVAPIEASQYLGEVTWNAQGSGGNFTMKAAISRVAGSYYEIQGQVQDAYGIAVFSGGGVLVGDNLILTVTATPMDAQEAVVMQININKSTNNGFFYTVKVGGPINSGTLTVSGNPIILATSNEGAKMLLLND